MPSSRRRSSSSIPPPFTRPDEIPLICTSKDIARFSQLTMTTIWRMIRDGNFSRFPPPRNQQRPYFWIKDDLLAFMSQPKLDLQPSWVQQARRRYQR